MAEISMLPVSTFYTTYPRNLFHKDKNGLLHHDSSKVTVFGDIEDVFSDNHPSHITLDGSSNDLKAWKTALMEKPIVFLVTMSFVDPATDACRDTGEYVVFINSLDTSMQHQMQEAFGRCEGIHNARKKFSLKISIHNILRKWYANQHPDNTSSRCVIEGGSVILSSWSRGCADCESHPFLIGGCLPVAIFYGIPCLIYRAVKHKKLRLQLESAEFSPNSSCAGQDSVFESSSQLERQSNENGATTNESNITFLPNCINFFNDDPPAYETLSYPSPPPYEAAANTNN